MGAPASLTCSKLQCPDEKDSQVDMSEYSIEKVRPTRAKNLLAAMSRGVEDGTAISIGVAATLIAIIGAKPNPRINILTWVFCVSWCADLECRGNERRLDGDVQRIRQQSDAHGRVRHYLRRVVALPPWLRQCLSLRFRCLRG